MLRAFSGGLARHFKKKLTESTSAMCKPDCAPVALESGILPGLVTQKGQADSPLAAMTLRRGDETADRGAGPK